MGTTRSKRPATRKRPAPKPPVHPGLILLERYIRARGLTQTEVARWLHMNRPRLNALLHGKVRINLDLALRLERLFEVEAEWWLTRQMHWDLWRARRSGVRTRRKGSAGEKEG